jgi:hypothetical protein
LASAGSPSYTEAQMSVRWLARAMSKVSVAEHMANRNPPDAT